MPDVWIGLTLTAALLQAVRTAGQKQLTGSISVLAGTYVRSLLGLPVMLVYLGLVKWIGGDAWPQINVRFLVAAFITGMTQIAATVALLSLFQLRNFAVANQLGKSDMIFTAVLGSLFLGQYMSPVAWVALALTGSGVATVMTAKTGVGPVTLRSIWDERSVRMGLFIGLMFGICNLALREAALALAPSSGFMAGAVTVAVVTAMQAILMGVWLRQREPDAHGAIGSALALSSFVGVTSALGSICWFTAFAMTTAAHVRIVGQVEVVFTLLISALYFHEKISRLEAAGIAVTIAGIVLLQLVV